LDRLLNKRLEGMVSQLGMRSPTQCGFRPGHGTFDAIFTLQHLSNAAQHNKHSLFVAFVYFETAFYTVRQDLLLERCRQLGVHGQFMDMLVVLCDRARVCCCVDVNGALGEQFATAAGTKQGSELSPLL
jgi:hypothetical protein